MTSPTEDTPTPQGGLEQPGSNSQSVATKSLPSAPSKPDVAKAILELQEALYYHLIKLEFIKVDRLPIIDGNEVTHICGVPLRTHIYEDEADYWRHTSVTDLASNNPEASAELSNPPKDMDTSKSLDDKLRNVLWEVGHNSINSSDAISQIKQAIVEAVEGIYGDSDGLREFASTPTNQVVNPNVNKRKAA